MSTSSKHMLSRIDVAKLIDLFDIQSFRSQWARHVKVLVEFTASVSMAEVIIYSFRVQPDRQTDSWDLN